MGDRHHEARSSGRQGAADPVRLFQPAERYSTIGCFNFETEEVTHRCGARHFRFGKGSVLDEKLNGVRPSTGEDEWRNVKTDTPEALLFDTACNGKRFSGAHTPSSAAEAMKASAKIALP